MTQKQQQQQQPQQYHEHPTDLINDFQQQNSNIVQYQWPSLLDPDVTNPPIKWIIGSKFVIPAVGLFSKFWMNVVNKSTVYNANILYETLNRNYLALKSNCAKRRPVITYCNHTSCMDDPLIWGSLMPLSWLLNSDRQRWTSAAADICFSSKFYTTFFSLGKAFPMVRGEGIYQPSMNFASRLMQNGYWLHFFPEGKVIPRPENSDQALLKFNIEDYFEKKDQQFVEKARPYSLKWGIARLIIEHVLSEGETKDEEYSKIIPNQFSMSELPESSSSKNENCFCETLPEVDVLPMYHIGMDDVLPTRLPYIPRMFCRVTLLVRPEGPIRIDKNFLMKLFHDPDPNDPYNTSKDNQINQSRTELSLTEKRIRLMKFLENELNILAEKTKLLHFFSEKLQKSTIEASDNSKIKSKQ